MREVIMDEGLSGAIIELPKGELHLSVKFTGIVYSAFGSREAYLARAVWHIDGAEHVIVDDETLRLPPGKEGDDAALKEVAAFLADGWVDQQEEPTEAQLLWKKSGMSEYVAVELCEFKEEEY